MSYIIERITSKEVNTKFGAKPAYSIKANGEWYQYGFKKPVFNEGDEIDFQYTESSYGKQVDAKSVRTISKGSGSPTAAPTATIGGGGKPTYSAKVFPIPPLHGDRAIVRQNSITNATKLFCVAANIGDAVDFNAAATDIISIARMFEAYSCGDLEAEAAAKMMEE